MSAKKTDQNQAEPETVAAKTSQQTSEASLKVAVTESAGNTNNEAKAFKPKPMSSDYKSIFEGLSGSYQYTGATLAFRCRADKEHLLIPGKTYPISKLPQHELIANAILRRTLVKVEETKEA